MGLEYFGLTLVKDFKKNNIQNKTVQEIHKSPTLKKEELTPKTRMKKIKSEEDFVKFQIPWIL